MYLLFVSTLKGTGGSFTTPNHGAITEPTSTGLIYMPNTDFCGTDSFNYSIISGDMSDTATVTIVIRCENTPPPPSKSPISITPLDTANPAMATTSNPPAVTSPPSKSPISITPLDTANPTKAPASNPPAVTDPEAVNDSVTIAQDSGMVVDNVLGNDVPATSGAMMTVDSILYPANHGVCGVQNDTSVTYTPNAGYHGQDNCVYRACEVGGGCDTAVLTITIEPTPITEIEPTTLGCETNMNEPVIVNPLSSDVTLTADATYGTCVITEDSTVMYTPGPGYAGYDEVRSETSNKVFLSRKRLY